MGKRLHVHKKHVIEYAGDFFNWKFSEFQELLETLCCDTTPHSSEFPDDWEVTKKEYKRALDALKEAKNGAKEVTFKPLNEYENECIFDVEDEILPLLHKIYPDDIVKNVLNEGFDLKEKALNQIVEDMQYIYDNADENQEYIYFSCF